MLVNPIQGIPLIKPGDPLSRIIFDAVIRSGAQFLDDDVIVVTQKIVSKAENRLVNLATITPGDEAIRIASITDKDPRFVELILRESKAVLRVKEKGPKEGIIIVEHRLGFVCANAGIDHSNVEGAWGNADDWVLLLPEDPDQSAEKIRLELEEMSHTRLGVLIIDSHGRAWRMGTVGVSVGISGIPALIDLRGTRDMFGFQLRVTQVAAADELAAAASLVMGQTDERIPVVQVRGFPYKRAKSSINDLIRPKELDLFR